MIVLDDKTCPVGMIGNLDDVLFARILRFLHTLSRRAALG